MLSDDWPKFRSIAFTQFCVWCKALMPKTFLFSNEQMCKWYIFSRCLFYQRKYTLPWKTSISMIYASKRLSFWLILWLRSECKCKPDVSFPYFRSVCIYINILHVDVWVWPGSSSYLKCIKMWKYFYDSIWHYHFTKYLIAVITFRRLLTTHNNIFQKKNSSKLWCVE